MRSFVIHAMVGSIMVGLATPALAQQSASPGLLNPATGVHGSVAPSITLRTPSLGIYAPGALNDATNGAPPPGNSEQNKYPNAAASAVRLSNATVGRWVVFSDPAEHAFTIELPADWAVDGGVRRVSDVYVPYWVRAVAPNGAIEIFFGDPDVPMFTQPNQLLDMAGYREGTVAPIFGQLLAVQHYRAGDAFAAEWGSRRIGQRCQGAALSSVRPLPDASSSMDLAYAAGGTRSFIKAGEASFTCARGGQPSTGYVFAATELVQSGVPDNAVWQVKAFAGFVAASGLDGNAADDLAHAAASFRIDPDWLRRSNLATAAISQIVANADRAMSESIARRFANATRTRDEDFQRGIRAVRGVQKYYDPESGRTFELDNVAAHYWTGPGHRVPVPTADSNPPFPGAHELQMVH